MRIDAEDVKQATPDDGAAGHRRTVDLRGTRLGGTVVAAATAVAPIPASAASHYRRRRCSKRRGGAGAHKRSSADTSTVQTRPVVRVFHGASRRLRGRANPSANVTLQIVVRSLYRYAMHFVNDISIPAFELATAEYAALTFGGQMWNE